jgi:ACS family hexuronate transporter-like MFS transporter
MARGWGLDRARKTVIGCVSLAMLFLWIGVTQVQSQAAAVGMVALITFGHGAWGNVTLPAEVFPKRVVGTISGLGGCLGTLTGAWTQIQIGKVVESTGYKPLFFICSAMYLIAFFFVATFLKDLGRVREIT